MPDYNLSRAVEVPMTRARYVGGIALLLLVMLIWIKSRVERYRHIQHVTQVVGSLNGAVGADGPSDGVSFNIVGLSPLVTDQTLTELSPSMGHCDIREIGLGGTPVSDVALQAVIRYCHSSLRQLELSGTKITGDTIESLTECPNLESVSLSVDALSEPAIQAIRQMPKLQKVLLFNAAPSDVRVEKLKNVRPDLDVSVYSRSHFLAR